MTDLEKDKLRVLSRSEGFDGADEFLLAFGSDSVVPGICMLAACDYTCDVEPDCREGHCESCEDGTVKSCLIIAGLI